MRLQTYGYLPSRRTSLPCDWYQITLLGERGTLGVNNLPKVVIWQWNGRQSNWRRLSSKSITLTVTWPVRVNYYICFHHTLRDSANGGSCFNGSVPELSKVYVSPNTLQVISGTGFMGQKTQPAVSKHWRKRSPKDQASIPLGPPHCDDNNTTYMQYEKTQNTHRWTQLNLCYAQWNAPSVTKPNPDLFREQSQGFYSENVIGVWVRV